MLWLAKFPHSNGPWRQGFADDAVSNVLEDQRTVCDAFLLVISIADSLSD